MMDQRKQQYCQSLLIGTHPLDAYVQTYGLKDGEHRDSVNVKDRARAMAQHPDVVSRMQDLRAPVIQQAQATFGFTLTQASEKIDRAHALAESQGEPSIMLKAIELKAKLYKLLGEVKEVTGSGLDAHATADLVLLLTELKRRRDVDVVIEGSVIEGAVVGSPVSVECAHLL